MRVEGFRAKDGDQLDEPAPHRLAKQGGRLLYHEPPRWFEVEGLEEPRLVRGHNVTQPLGEMVPKLPRADENPTLAELSLGADRVDEW